MIQRSSEDLMHELQALDQAHAQNEAARDSFVALAHTALFAASVSFVGSAVPLAKAIWPIALIGGWALDVVGLLALTISFATARKAIDARRAALYEPDPPIAIWSGRLNGLALWSFPAALLCLFSFVAANVVHINDRSATPTPIAPVKRIERHNPPAAGALQCPDTANRRDAGAKSTCGSAASTGTSGALKALGTTTTR